MSYIAASIIVIVVSVALVLLIKRNLRQRPIARKYRAVFTSAAEDLIGKPEFPDAAAKFLITAGDVPAGWVTRGMFAMLLGEMLLGRSPAAPRRPILELVPPQLRVKYVQALLALALSDSYHCAILGRLWRGANLWVMDAVKEPKPDVNAHATRRVVEQVTLVRPPRTVHARELEECMAAA